MEPNVRHRDTATAIRAAAREAEQEQAAEESGSISVGDSGTVEESVQSTEASSPAAVAGIRPNAPITTAVSSTSSVIVRICLLTCLFFLNIITHNPIPITDAPSSVIHNGVLLLSPMIGTVLRAFVNCATDVLLAAIFPASPLLYTLYPALSLSFTE